VRSKIIPKGAKATADVRKNVIDQLVDAQRSAPLPKGAATATDEKMTDDARFARRVTRATEIDGAAWRTDFRCLVVGDVAIGVESLAPTSDADAVSKLADQMALSIKPLDDRPPAADSKPAPAQQPAEKPQQPTDKPRLPPTQTPGIPGIPGLGI
jgi:hypothetical protein